MKQRGTKIAATFVIGLLVIVGTALATPGVGVLGARSRARDECRRAERPQRDRHQVEDAEFGRLRHAAESRSRRAARPAGIAIPARFW